MGALAGIYSRSGASVDLDELSKASDALAHLGPDSSILVDCGHFGMLVRHFDADGNGNASGEPAVSDSGDVLVFEGRIDNAADLRSDLGAANGSVPTLLLNLFQTLGFEAFSRIVGDYTLALWDARQRQLLLVTDSLGRRPLYYHLTPSRLVWSTRSRSLIALARLPPRVDEAYIADYLVNTTPRGGPFVGVEMVPGGHVLAVGADYSRLTRYWSPNPNRTLRYRTDTEYEEHFLDVFTQAVECRLPRKSPVFCELSGGVDSSTIACTAQRSLARTDSQNALHTVSYVFDEAAKADERPYILLVEQLLGRPGVHFNERDYPLLAEVPRSFRPDLPTNSLCHLERHDAVARGMRTAGAHVLLNGIGGDQLFASTPSAVLVTCDLLAERRYRAWIATAREIAHRSHQPLLSVLAAGLRHRPGRDAIAIDYRATRFADWLLPDFVSRVGLRDRIAIADDIGFQLPSAAALYASIRRTMRPYALERTTTVGYVDMRYPYLDRRLLEFAFAIPFDQKVRLPESRSIVRRAFRGRMPDAIRLRQTKAGPTEAMCRAIVGQKPRLLSYIPDLRLAAYGFVDRDRLAGGIRDIGNGVTAQVGQMTRALALEAWLRSLDNCPHELSSRRDVVNRPSIRRPFSKEAHHEHDLRIAGVG